MPGLLPSGHRGTWIGEQRPALGGRSVLNEPMSAADRTVAGPGSPALHG